MANSPTAIRTASGRFFDVLRPDPADIHVRDIAHALAMLPRFGGHSRFHWSVASHSIRVAALCPAGDALAGLLHDASEAYLIDIPRPIKYSAPLAGYRAVEAAVEAAIAARFGLPAALPPAVKAADNLMLWAEATALFDDGYAGWMLQPADADRARIEELSARVVGRAPAEAEAEFLAKFFEYGGEEA